MEIATEHDTAAERTQIFDIVILNMYNSRKINTCLKACDIRGGSHEQKKL